MLDLERIAELREEVGADAFGEVVEMFVEEVEEVLHRLDPSAEFAETADKLHFLRGCALNLGFRRFADECYTREKILRTGQNADLSALPGYFDASCTALACQSDAGLVRMAV